MNIRTLSELREIYGPASDRAVKKEIPALDSHAIQFIGFSPFVVLASVNADGDLDSSPRGGQAGFVKVRDTHTLLIPDAPGNNRLDTLENIISTGHLGLLFLVPGFDETLRVNGRAVLSIAPEDLAFCADQRRTPLLAIRVSVDSVYLHCAKALMRSKLWDPACQIERSQMPPMGEMLRHQVRQFKDEEIDVESQAEMLARYQRSL
jgi:PPOX class probable FMN-dependent enzyme